MAGRGRESEAPVGPKRGDTASKSTTAKRRYQEFEQANEAWDGKVKKSISKIEKVVRHSKNGRVQRSR